MNDRVATKAAARAVVIPEGVAKAHDTRGTP